MRVVVVALAIFTLFTSLGGCARKPDVTYVELPPTAPTVHSAEPHPATQPARALADNSAASQLSHSSSGALEKDWITRVADRDVEETEIAFDAILEKADQVGVEHLTQADIRGLSFDQIQQLRGY